MARRQTKTVNMIFLLAILSAVALINGIFLPVHTGIKIFSLIGGVLGLIWAYFWQLIEQGKRQYRCELEAKAAAEELIEHFKQVDFELCIYDKSQLLIWSCLTCSFMALFISPSGFVLVLLATIAFLLRYSKTSNHPILVLNSTSITFQSKQTIAWSKIAQVKMTYIRNDLSVQNCWNLSFLFQTEETDQVHTTKVVSLYKPNVSAELICQVAKKLQDSAKQPSPI